MRKKLWGGALLAAVCLLPLQAVVADDNRYEPVKPAPDTQTVYITDIRTENAHTYVTADPIQWYEGAAADKVFREREPDSGMTEAPDDYYIVNDAVDPHTYELAPDAVVEMQFYNRTGNWSEADIQWNERVSAAKFVSLFTPADKDVMMGFPYHLTVRNGTIVQVVQQYVP